ncbi:MAG: polysaccharide biosynthesis/export family protein [Smithellaceae bacterium]|jgi:polysaccharide export outer membrane protein
MNKKFGRSLLYVLLASIVLIGCASTKPLPDNAKLDDSKKVDLHISEFVLGAGDTVEIAVFRQDDLKRSVKIDTSGKVMFPLIGDIQVAGKGIFTLRDELKERYSVYLVNPQITVTVTAISSKKFMVLGEVSTPGVFTIDTDLTIIEAIAKAGGMTHDAKENKVIVIRRGKEKPELLSFSFKDVWEKGDVTGNVTLQPGDIVYVSTKTIADMGRFMQYIGQIISPIVSIESGIVLWPQVVDVLQGKQSTTSFSVPIQ